MPWYLHPSIDRGWLCEALYGDRSKANTSKLSQKLRGVNKQRLLEKELTKLEEIRKQLLSELSG